MIEPGDIVFRNMAPWGLGRLDPFVRSQGHVGIYVGTKLQKIECDHFMIVDMSGWQCRRVDLKTFCLEGSHCGYIKPPLNRDQRNGIVKTANTLAKWGGRIKYAFFGHNWYNPRKPSFRCDGLVHYCYERGAKFRLLGAPPGALGSTESSPAMLLQAAVHYGWANSLSTIYP